MQILLFPFFSKFSFSKKEQILFLRHFQIDFNRLYLVKTGDSLLKTTLLTLSDVPPNHFIICIYRKNTVITV